jgi:hypothetical protein
MTVTATEVTTSTLVPLHGKKLTKKQIKEDATTIFVTLFVMAIIWVLVCWALIANGYKTAGIVLGGYVGIGLLSTALFAGDTLGLAEEGKINIYSQNTSSQ